MQLYLLRDKELRMTMLPSRVSGQYTVDYTNEHGNVVPLVRINARDDKWYLIENNNVIIHGNNKVENAKYEEYELKENCIYYLLRDNTEKMILMVEPETFSRARYQLYTIPFSEEISIGQSSDNQIQFNNRFINNGKHMSIQYADGLPQTLRYCTDLEIENDSLIYLNDKKVVGEEKLKVGDIIFLYGLKIILGKDFIAVNNPDDKVSVHLTKKKVDNFVSLQSDEESKPLVTFSSEPRARKEFIHKIFNIENPPEGLQEDDTPWIVMLGPSITMAMGSVFSSVITINNIVASSGSINSALPSLVTSVVMVMGSAVWPIVGRRVQHRSQVRKAVIASDDYEEYLGKLKDDIENAMTVQKEILEENNPLIEECVNTIIQQSGNLWERSQRHKDFLEVMIGKGDVPLDAEFSYPDRSYHSEISESAKAMYDLVAKEHLVENVPVTLPLVDAGIVGVVGDRKDIISFAKGLLIELTSMHNYEDLKIIFIYNEKERSEWEFVKWIPHLWNDEHSIRYLANDPDEVKILSDYINNLKSVQDHNSNNKVKEGPYYIIFAADKTLAERAQAIKELYQSPEDYNMTVFALYNERQYLPKACSYVIDLIHERERMANPEKYADVAATLADYSDITGKRIVCHERIGYEGNPEDIFVKMANIHLDSPISAKQLPTNLTFNEMFEIGKPEHLDLIRRWKESSSVNSLSVPIGVDSDGYFINLDIHEKAHGPHGLIAGMTGSGKSEFIVSYIASLAINFSPEDVAFVFIDFKGGGMADIFKDLPHTAGLITNLDGNELKRSFLAIEHELEKRQKLFKEISDLKKISNIDINKYQKLRKDDPTLKPLPHIVLISDEFAELKQQQGDFIGQLIRIARIGRSLGIHLILATQKPDGIVNDQIRSNIRYKVCLKVQDKADSQGMIGRPDATLITNPGRFYFQVGNNEVFEYGQSPWSGAMYEPQDHVQKNVCDSIEILNEQGYVIYREFIPKPPRMPGVPEKQIDALVLFIKEVAEQHNLVAEKLWLNPLPTPKEEKKKASIYETDIVPYVMNPIIGNYDDLVSQKHLPLTIPFTTQGNALIYGASGSGKLELVYKTLISIMDNHSPEEVNFVLFDYDSGSLAAFEDSEYTKAFAMVGDTKIAENALNEIVSEMEDRRDRLRKYGGNFQNYIKTSGEVMPNIIFVIHNYQNFVESDPQLKPKLSVISRECIKYGIYMMVTTTTSESIQWALRPMFKNTYTLWQNAEDQYRDIVGRTDGIVPGQFRGRGLVRANGTVCEFQTDMVFEDAENVYESIQDYCKEVSAKWSNHPVEVEVQEEKEIPVKPIVQKETKKTSKTVKKEVEVPKTVKKVKKHVLPEGYEYRLDALPIGVDDQGNIVFYNFLEKASNSIIYDKGHKDQLRVIDKSIRRAIPENATVYELHPGNDKNDELIDDILWSTVLRRGHEGMEAKEAGNPYPDFDPIIVFVNSPAEIVKELGASAQSHFSGMITKLTPAYHIYFIIYENSDNSTALIQGNCLSLYFPVYEGILLSSDQSSYILYDEDVEFKGTIRSPLGFVIHENIPTKVTVEEWE